MKQTGSITSSIAQRRINTVERSTAQIPEMCLALLEVMKGKEVLTEEQLQGLAIRADIVLCVSLQLLYSLRISEVLSITLSNIDSKGRIYIKSKKGSNNAVINDTLISAIMVEMKRQHREPFIDLDRFFVYRYYFRLGIKCESSGKYKNAVTHSFRHQTAKEIRNFSLDENDITLALRHKSDKSRNYYGKK